MSVSPYVQWSSLELLVSTLSTTRYLDVAATTVLIWDMVVTFDIEVQRVWLAPKTFGTSLFFFNRYLPLVVLFYSVYYQFLPSPSLSFCKTFEWSYAILIVVSASSIACVLTMRTNALYRSNALFFLLTSLGVLSVANMIACAIITVSHTNFGQLNKPVGFNGCYEECGSTCKKALTVFWVPFFLFETVVLVLTIRKYWQEYQIFNRSVVLEVVMRDGLIYYFVILAVGIANILMNPVKAFVAIGLSKALQTAICSRMLLNLRGLLETTRRGSRFQSGPPGTLLQMTSLRPSWDDESDYDREES